MHWQSENFPHEIDETVAALFLPCYVPAALEFVPRIETLRSHFDFLLVLVIVDIPALINPQRIIHHKPSPKKQLRHGVTNSDAKGAPRLP
jgi:hypothetical protein